MGLSLFALHPVGAGLCSYNLPRKKVTSIWISNVPSIDGRYSTATGCKFGTPVSGGAYQDARKVSIEWNARLKHRRSPEFRCRMHQTVTQRPFSPPSFPARRKRRGRRRRVRNDHDGTSRRKRRLLSSVLVSSFPNRKLNLRFGFSYANLIQPLSLGCAEPAPLEGEPRSAHRRKCQGNECRPLSQPAADSSPGRGAFLSAAAEVIPLPGQRRGRGSRWSRTDPRMCPLSACRSA